MKPLAWFLSTPAILALMSLMLATPAGLGAQTAATGPTSSPSATAPTTPPRGVKLEELSQAELLKAYLSVQEQLHATQLSILNNRLETEAAARAQATALAEKLESLRTSLEAERERARVEQQRVDAQRALEQREAQRSTRRIIGWSAGFLGLGVLAAAFILFLQWRAMRKLGALAVTTQPALPAPVAGRQALAVGGLTPASDQAVNDSNQRLLSTLNRIEERIADLETTSAASRASAAPFATPDKPVAVPDLETRASRAPFPPRVLSETQAAGTSSQAVSLNAAAEPSDAAVRLLGRGRLLIESGRPKDAIGCYDEILRLEPANAEALVRKGVALEQLKRDEEALQCYNLAIRADRKKTLAYLCKGAVCNRLKRYEESVESYEQALRTEETESA
jgi:tetratricopeptide (TPR) repeat protein